jgi:hypothetical protein
MVVSLSLWATASARIIIGFRYCFERGCIQREVHLKSELVPVDDNGKVVPRLWLGLCVEKYGAIVRTDAEFSGDVIGDRRSARCTYKKGGGVCHPRRIVSLGLFSIRAFGLAESVRTSLEIKNGSSIGLLDPHGLILMRVIKRSFFVRAYREVERSDAILYRFIEHGLVSALW